MFLLAALGTILAAEIVVALLLFKQSDDLKTEQQHVQKLQSRAYDILEEVTDQTHQEAQEILKQAQAKANAMVNELPDVQAELKKSAAAAVQETIDSFKIETTTQLASFKDALAKDLATSQAEISQAFKTQLEELRQNQAQQLQAQAEQLLAEALTGQISAELTKKQQTSIVKNTIEKAWEKGLLKA